ncbi:hypothetical protein QI155_10775 [Thermodesulfovibrio sp. 1176]|uniref:hypothetical protein n=1 Tax=Thermodesulfovibrio sp. 1176 TaxID=3043424 RepID=UPI00248309A2|nr:hypothetical protein [Thermodesulfovibrio sp. 1176]MDI1473015.1 hypothetical protein [Thermodesulfovibrio sp. 1176]
MFRYPETLQEQNINPELSGIKRLIGSIIVLAFNDLKKLIKNPVYYSNFLASRGEAAEQVIKFWEEDAYVFLSFILNDYRSGKIINKIKPLVAEAKEKLNVYKI